VLNIREDSSVLLFSDGST